MATSWHDYQEEAAALFRSMGLDAATDVTMRGVRTSHDIDVVVRSHHAGFDITWLLECKHWKSRVSKLHVLALREIVADLGADRGILLCETGFHSGAVEAANLTNVQVASLEQLRSTAGRDIAAMRLRELYDRIESCKVRYWEIPKDVRIARGLRPEFYEDGYSGTVTLELCGEVVTRALRGIYPFTPDSLTAFVEWKGQKEFSSVEEVIRFVTPMIEELEQKLRAVETGQSPR